MSTLTKTDLENLLKEKSFGNTLFSYIYDKDPFDVSLAPTEIARLDTKLGGGLPRGHLSEIVGEHTTGRMSVMHAAFAAATNRGELVALIDTFDTFDPESGAEAGIDFSRFLWIRGGADSNEPMSHIVNRSLKALECLVHAGGFGVVTLDLVDLPERVFRRIPFTTWKRLAHAVKDQPTAYLLIGDRSIARSVAGVTLRLESRKKATRWSCKSTHSALWHGFDIVVRVIGTRFPQEGRYCQLFASMPTYSHISNF